MQTCATGIQSEEDRYALLLLLLMSDDDDDDDWDDPDLHRNVTIYSVVISMVDSFHSSSSLLVFEFVFDSDMISSYDFWSFVHAFATSNLVVSSVGDFLPMPLLVLLFEPALPPFFAFVLDMPIPDGAM